MVHTFISCFWFRDLGKSLATSLMRSMFHGSVEEQNSLFYNLFSPWKVHGALLSRKAVCFSFISGISAMSHCSYPNLKQLFLNNFMRSPNEEGLAFKQACCCYQRQFITFFSRFFYLLLHLWVTGSYMWELWTRSTRAASTLIQASWDEHCMARWAD